MRVRRVAIPVRSSAGGVEPRMRAPAGPANRHRPCGPGRGRRQWVGRRGGSRRVDARRAAIATGWTRPGSRRGSGPTRRPRAPPSTRSAVDAARADGGGGDAGFELLGAPLVFAPTPRGFGLSVVLRSGDPTSLELRVRDEELSAWSVLGPPLSPAVDIAQWTVDGLAPGRRYIYEVSAPGDRRRNGLARLVRSAGASLLLYTGSAVTAPAPGDSVHLRPHHRHAHRAARSGSPGDTVIDDSYGTMETTLLAVTAEVAAAKPDFVINLGDMLDYHLFGFNAPPPDASWARLGYLNYRRLLGDTVGHAAHFPVIGNWDGESGCNTPDEIARSMSQRLLYAPGPGPDTYPEGGSANGDYYAFTWGDALFVVLNVMTYTPTCHLLGSTTLVWPTTGRWAPRSWRGSTRPWPTRARNGAFSSSITRSAAQRATRTIRPTGGAADRPPTSASRRRSTP